MIFAVVISIGSSVFSASGEMTEKQLRKEVSQLLKELEGFKDDSNFRQCLFGCGSENPGHAWNERRKALQEAVPKQMEVPLMLKAAPANLYMLGKAYFDNNANDIKYFKDDILEAIKK